VKSINKLSSKTTCRLVGHAYDLGLGQFPAVVRVETTNACNAKCTICPHKDLRRPITRMDDTLFGQIIDECATFGCGEVHLHNFGEPLLDKALETRVKYAKDRGLRKVKIFCNGSLLTEKRARGLIEAGLDEIKISFDGATQEEFEQIRPPLKFGTVVENIKQLVALRDELKSPMRVNVACCSTSDKAGTMETLEQLVDGFSFGKVHNWGSEEYTENRGRIRKPCSRVWRTFTILASGDVSLCCLDYDGQVILGQIAPTTSIRDVYHGEAYQRIRALHKQARQVEIDICRNCTKSFL